MSAFHAPPPMPGTLIPNDEAYGLRDAVKELLQRDNPRFPGAQPVSFAREHVAELQRQEYFMCEKTDGLRVLLLLHWFEAPNGDFAPATFLIDRKNNYYNVTPPFTIPHYQYPNDTDKFLFGTLLDGELVHDQYPGEAAPRLNFYVFDALAVDSESIMAKPLDKRLGRLQEFVLKPYLVRLNQMYGNAIRPDDLKPFALKKKETYPAYALDTMFNKVLPTLRHGNDGLIFTCKSTPYQPGTDRHILKWKPPHENTIDFKLKLGDFPLIDADDGEPGQIPDYDAIPAPLQLLILHNQNKYQPFSTLSVTPAEWEIMKGLDERLDGRIIECYRNPAGHWKFKTESNGAPRWRDDKKDANHISTVNSVLESIEQPVTQANLLENQETIKKSDYARKGKTYAPPQDGGERDPKKRKLSDGGS